MQEPHTRKPGDLILDRAMPNASPEEREAARANLDRLAALIANILLRESAKHAQPSIRTKHVSEVES